MATVPHPSMLVSLGIGALVLWRVYKRVRRMVGRQKLSGWRPWLTVTLFPLLAAMLLALALLGPVPHPFNALALVAGAALGVALGLYGLRLTAFEATPAGLFYTPNAHLGIAISLLFIGRIGWRLIEVYAAAGPVAPPHTDFARSPLTLVIFGTLAGYYVSYAAGLIRWSRRVAVDSSSARASD